MRLRDTPALDGRILGSLTLEERVELLDFSAVKMKIGEMNSFWYKVRTEDGTGGWSYGHFISISPEDLLVRAVFLGRLDVVNELLQSGVQVDKVFRETGMDFGSEYYLEATPLAFAVKSGSEEIVSALLGTGADPSVRWSYSEPGGDIVKTLLALAVDAGEADIADLLLEAGVNVEETSYFASSPGGLGVSTPLIAAAAAGNLPLVRRLVSAGADPARVLRYEPKYGEPVSVSALSAAVKSGHADIAAFLASLGAED